MSANQQPALTAACACRTDALIALQQSCTCRIVQILAMLRVGCASLQAAVTPEEVTEAISSFVPTLGKSLLFMGHLCSLRLLTWTSADAQPILVTKVHFHDVLSCPDFSQLVCYAP